jgi:hypothetical protein
LVQTKSPKDIGIVFIRGMFAVVSVDMVKCIGTVEGIFATVNVDIIIRNDLV